MPKSRRTPRVGAGSVGIGMGGGGLGEGIPQGRNEVENADGSVTIVSSVSDDVEVARIRGRQVRRMFFDGAGTGLGGSLGGLQIGDTSGLPPVSDDSPTDEDEENNDNLTASPTHDMHGLHTPIAVREASARQNYRGTEEMEVMFVSPDSAIVSSGSGNQYTVTLGETASEDSCNCRGFRTHRHCRHINGACEAASIAQIDNSRFRTTRQVSHDNDRTERQERQAAQDTRNRINDNFKLSEMSAAARKRWYDSIDDGNYEALAEQNVLNGSDNTFGLELEMVGIANKDDFIRELREAGLTSATYQLGYHRSAASGWSPTSDGSLGYGGVEMVSPILKDTPQTWQNLNKLCEIARRHGGSINDTCGGHIHIGANALGTSENAWRNFLRLYKASEPIVDIVARAGQDNIRRGASSYAIPMNAYSRNHVIPVRENTADNLRANIRDIYEQETNTPVRSRYEAINITQMFNSSSPKPTIEFRRFNGSVNAETVQANVLLANSMIEAAKSKTPQEVDELCNNLATMRSNRSRTTALIDFITTRQEDKKRLAKAYLKNAKRNR